MIAVIMIIWYSTAIDITMQIRRFFILNLQNFGISRFYPDNAVLRPRYQDNDQLISL